MSVYSSELEVHPLTEIPSFGAVVKGLDPARLDDDTIRTALRRLWIDAGIVVFDGLDDAETHLALSRVFGPLIAHPVQAQDPSRREILTVRHDPEDAYLVAIDGAVMGAWLPWHSDLVHVDRINHGGILRPIKLPSRGGATGFIDKAAAYALLPDRLKARIEGLEVVYQFDRDPSHQRFGKTADIEVVSINQRSRAYADRQFPRVRHPMVFVQPETGRKMLNVSPWFALGVADVAPVEGDALLDDVVGYATDPRNAYYHAWKTGQMLLFDNWRVLHCAAGAPADEERWLERTTIEGDYGVGRADEGESVEDSARIEV